MAQVAPLMVECGKECYVQARVCVQLARCVLPVQALCPFFPSFLVPALMNASIMSSKCCLVRI